MAAESAYSSEPSEEDDLRHLVRQSRLPVFLFMLAEGQILEVSDSLTALFEATREDMVGRVVLDFVVDEVGALARCALLAAGDLDGYHMMRRRYRRMDGSEFSVGTTAVNGFGEAAPVRYAVGSLMPDAGPGAAASGCVPPTDAVVLGTVDGQWQIDRISADVERLLGFSHSELVGKPIVGFVEPADMPALLVGVARGLQTPGGATIHIRVGTGSSPRRPCRMLVTRLAGGAANGLGFAFALADSVPHVVDRTWELERVLQHIAREIETTGVLAGLWGTPGAAPVPALAGLSAREFEIVRRLLVGDRVPMIAQELFLSESTVRNHLTSVYRKLGVRSQQQLLTQLRNQVPGNSGEIV